MDIFRDTRIFQECGFGSPDEEKTDGNIVFRRDLSRQRMIDEFKTFRRSVNKNDDVLLYFMGHGITSDGDMYLVPTDAPQPPTLDASNVDEHCVPLSHLISGVSEAGARVKIFIIDACQEKLDSPVVGITIPTNQSKMGPSSSTSSSQTPMAVTRRTPVGSPRMKTKVKHTRSSKEGTNVYTLFATSRDTTAISGDDSTWFGECFLKVIRKPDTMLLNFAPRIRKMMTTGSDYKRDDQDGGLGDRQVCETNDTISDTRLFSWKFIVY